MIEFVVCEPCELGGKRRVISYGYSFICLGYIGAKVTVSVEVVQGMKMNVMRFQSQSIFQLLLQI